MNMWEREIEELEENLSTGLIDSHEYNERMREIEREMRDEALEEAERAAEQAYNDIIGY
jgi:hypothetical protein